jgi:hypothetical protein
MRYCSFVSGLKITCVGASSCPACAAGTWIDDVARVVAAWARVVDIAAA